MSETEQVCCSVRCNLEFSTVAIRGSRKWVFFFGGLQSGDRDLIDIIVNVQS